MRWRELAIAIACMVCLADNAMAQVTKQPFEQGDLLPFIDVGHQNSRQKGNWIQDGKSLTLGGAIKSEPLNNRWIALPFESDGSPLTLEIEVERLAPGPLGIEFPIGSRKPPESIECVFDENGRYCGPRYFDKLPPGSQVDSLKKKSPSREFPKGLIPLRRKVILTLDVSPQRIVGKVGSITAFDFEVDLARMTMPNLESASRPRGRLLLMSDGGQFRFTRIFVKGKGTVTSLSPPGTITPPKVEVVAAPAPPPPPRPLPPPIADLAVGTWKIKSLSETPRFDGTTFVVVSCQKGEVRGVLQWVSSNGWAFEILRGQVVGNRLTLNGLDFQGKGYFLRLGRYPGEVAPDGKSFRNVSTVIDGRRIRDEDRIERWEAEWIGPEMKLEPRARTAFDQAFQDRTDEEYLVRQFTQYGYMTDVEKTLILHHHRADRLRLAELAKSTKPQVVSTALAMMQAENLRDLKNGIANISNAVKRFEQEAAELSQRRAIANETAERNRERDLSRAQGIANFQNQQQAIADANTRYANTVSGFGSTFNVPGAIAIQLNDVERMRISVRQVECNHTINQQVRELLRERPAPATPAKKSWGAKLEPGLDQLTVILINSSKETLHNCVFVTDFAVDQKKAKADWDKQQQGMPYLNALIAGLTGLSDDVQQLTAEETNLRFELLSQDSGYSIVLPEWRPHEQVRFYIAATASAKYCRSAGVAVWTDETGFQDTRIPATQFVDALKKLPPWSPNSLRKK